MFQKERFKMLCANALLELARLCRHEVIQSELVDDPSTREGYNYSNLLQNVTDVQLQDLKVPTTRVLTLTSKYQEGTLCKFLFFLL